MRAKFFLPIYVALFILNLFACQSRPQEVILTIYNTSDVHGSLFDYDLKRNQPKNSSLANVSEYLKSARAQNPEGVVLLDGGDFLQGQPSNYYYNFIDTTNGNIVAKMMNYLQYDAAAVGNHDIEAGHPVYDRVNTELSFPWLSANTINLKNGEPYFKPYTVIVRKGVKIAVLGMTTPGIPKWLPVHLWEGVEFQDMIETAQYWVPKIKETEKPDLLIGLFHAGTNYNYAGEDENTPRNENAGILVAKKVDGFDLILLGHDHRETQMEITNDAGHKVVVLDPKSHATLLGKTDIKLTLEKGHYTKQITTELIDLTTIPKDTIFLATFEPEKQQVKKFIDTEIGEFTENISSRDGLFGPSTFTDLIHNAQLAVTGADVSFSTVLQIDAIIHKGIITIRDMFNLYSYENGLYVMNFTGDEIDKYLEYAYGLQYNTMSSAKDHLLQLKTDSTGNLIKNKSGNCVTNTDFYNFSCAAGIHYTVDITQQPGERVSISSMSDGSAFNLQQIYRVAINSYRANGGGGHLSLGLGWTKENMNKRIVEIMPKDVRHYITEYIKNEKILTPKCRNDWQVIPTNFFQQGKATDYPLLYN